MKTKDDRKDEAHAIYEAAYMPAQKIYEALEMPAREIYDKARRDYDVIAEAAWEAFDIIRQPAWTIYQETLDAIDTEPIDEIKTKEHQKVTAYNKYRTAIRLAERIYDTTIDAINNKEVTK